MKVALLGLMQSGMSTLFSAISGKEPSPLGATAIDEAIVSVPDERLEWLSDFYKPKKTTPAEFELLAGGDTEVADASVCGEHGQQRPDAV